MPALCQCQPWVVDTELTVHRRQPGNVLLGTAFFSDPHPPVSIPVMVKWVRWYYEVFSLLQDSFFLPPGQYWKPWGLLVCPVNLYPNTPSVSSVDFQQSNISKLSKLGCSLIHICTFSVLTQLILFLRLISYLSICVIMKVRFQLMLADRCHHLELINLKPSINHNHFRNRYFGPG